MVNKNYGRSVELLTEALAKKKWQLDSPARHRFSILYNRGCAYARLGEKDKAIGDLRQAIPDSVPSDAELGKQFLADIRLLKVYFLDDVRGPYGSQAEGDLYNLQKDPVFRERMQDLAQRLESY